MTTHHAGEHGHMGPKAIVEAVGAASIDAWVIGRLRAYWKYKGLEPGVGLIALELIASGLVVLLVGVAFERVAASPWRKVRAYFPNMEGILARMPWKRKENRDGPAISQTKG